MILASLPLLAIRLTACHNSPPDPWLEAVEAVRRGESDRIEIADRVVGDTELATLAGLPQLRELLIENSSATDQGAQLLATLQHLEHVRLRGARIGDPGLAALAKLPRLRFLNLPHADCTDEGLEVLRDAGKLELLRIGSPRVTDRGLAIFPQIASLRFLHLIQIPVTDQGLRHLEAAQQLQSFYIDGAQVTDEGIERLATKVPHLHIHIDQRHSDLDPRKHEH